MNPGKTQTGERLIISAKDIGKWGLENNFWYFLRRINTGSCSNLNTYDVLEDDNQDLRCFCGIHFHRLEFILADI